MGLLIDGRWHDQWYDTRSTGGRFVRQAAQFRERVSREPGAAHPVEPARYRLYVSYACPWAHRALIGRALKGLEDDIAVTVVHPEMLENGWELRDGYEDALYGMQFLYQLYQRADPSYTGRVTVPVLWDEKKESVVCNESSEILRMLDEQFAPERAPHLRPAALRSEIDAINDRVYPNVNNGVYRAGFATSQEAYDEAVHQLFATLDWLEAHLQGRTWLVGEQLTEADIRLFTTLVRFDPVYYVHFKCSRKRICDYENLWRLTRRVYQLPGVAATVRMDHIRRHYFYSHQTINPHRIVAIEPAIDLDEPV
ncbi:MAG: glutathione S-transferase family protein [Sandaracinaceae bacterium]|nr:glutathione S-transferase family protein [Sandaracinaceae bacterium]